MTASSAPVVASGVAVAPNVLVAAAVLVGPGLVVGVLLGLRGVLLTGLAAPLSVTVVAVAAVVAPWAGADFGLLPVLAVTALAGLLAGLARFALRRIAGGPVAPRDGWRVLGSALLGVAVAAVCAALAVRRGIPRPDAVPQTFDAVFHLNAVAQVGRTGNGSSLALGTLTAPERTSGFYPAAWHDVTALVLDLTGSTAVVSANVVSLVIAAVVWPLGAVALARVAFGPRPGVLLAAGLLSTSFSAAPYLLLSYGTLWPNALGTALLPGLLAGLVALVRSGSRWGGLAPALAALVSLPGLALAHPNVVVSLALLSTAAGATIAVQWAAAPARGRPRRLAAVVVGLGVVAVGELWFVARSPVFATVRHTSWPRRESLAQAVGEWVAAAPQRAPVPFLLALLVLVGFVTAVREPRHRWLAVTHVASGAAFVLVAGSDSGTVRALSGPWYDDPFRLAALLGVTAVPLAALGVLTTAKGLTRAVGAGRREAAGWVGRVRWALVPGLALLLVLVSGAGYAGDNGRVLATWYAGTALAGPQETALLARLPRWVPDGNSVAGNPWNGSALAGAVGGVDFLYPHLQGSWGADRVLLAARLDEAATEPQVCAAARRLHVGFVLDGPVSFWPGDWRQPRYAGLAVAGRPGFEPVDTGGRLTLYRVTTCGLGGSSAGPSDYPAVARQ
jgi:hypothetical protein